MIIWLWIHSVSSSSQSLRHHKSKTVRTRKLIFWEYVFSPPCVTSHMSYVRCLWRVCYQWRLPCLVFSDIAHYFFTMQNWLIQVKEEGFSEGEARGKSWGAALPAWGKPRPSQLFYLDLHSILNRIFWWYLWFFQILMFEETY